MYIVAKQLNGLSCFSTTVTSPENTLHVDDEFRSAHRKGKNTSLEECVLDY